MHVTGGGALEFNAWALPSPQITYFFQDLYKEIILGNPKKVGSLGSRWGLDLEVCNGLQRGWALLFS